MPSLDSREVVLMAKMQPGSIMIVGLERTLLLGIFSLFPHTFAYELTLAFLWNSH